MPLNEVLHKRIWTDVYGFARSFIALGTLLTLLFNDIDTLFIPISGDVSSSTCVGLVKLSIFCQVPRTYFEIVKWVIICLLLVIISGWRPRYTGLFHWWISFSISVSATIIDGGDQIAAALTLLMVPITLTDNRKWHWSIKQTSDISHSQSFWYYFKNVTAYVFYLFIRIQVSVVYFQAFVAKLDVTEWINGTALYYWFNNEWYGASGWLLDMINPLLYYGSFVTITTWFVIVLEIILFCGLFMAKKWWPVLLYSGLIFHFAIAVVHGLISFFFVMIGALIIYLHPIEIPINIGVKNVLKKKGSVS